MGVALENARLFDETKRLLAETDQRAAELAVINEIGAALAEQLDFAGDRTSSSASGSGRSFDARSMYIALYDEATRRSSRSRTTIEEGERFDAPTSDARAGD